MRQRIYFDVDEPGTKDIIECFVDLWRHDGHTHITDWGAFYDRIFNNGSKLHEEITVGAFYSGGRVVQPAWLYEIVQKKAQEAVFPADEYEGRFVIETHQSK